MILRSLSFIALFLAFVMPAVGPQDSTPSDPAAVRATSTLALEGLPAIVSVRDHMGTALVADLATPLRGIPGEAITEYRAGDIGYWAEEQRLFVFLADGSALPDTPVVIVGRIVDGSDALQACGQECAVEFDATASEQLR